MKKYLITIITAILVAGFSAGSPAKNADLAGTWYSPSSVELEREIEAYLRNAGTYKPEGKIIGVLAPHAGLRFSGPVAAHVYKAIGLADPDKIILVAFTHRRYFPDKISVFTDRSFVTPLGRLEIDEDLTEKFLAFDENIESIPEAFDSENSVEMQIPFIQKVSKDARVVILVLGDQRIGNCKRLVDALYNILKDEKSFLIVASSDMSHYLDYDSANTKDAGTAGLIKNFDPDLFFRESLKKDHNLMCGYGATYTVMTASKMLGANEVDILKYANSGDTFGGKDRVVGYLSAVFVKKGQGAEDVMSEVCRNVPVSAARVNGYEEKEKSMFTKAQKKELLKIARDTIKHKLETGGKLEVAVDDEALKQDMGSFVTLHAGGRLRGCIGHMVATGPFFLTVRDMAIAAATEDPRFQSMTLEEMDDIDIEISALSPMEKIDDHNVIEMGKHGVMVKMGLRSGVYLPQVADETGWTKEEFMNSLCTQKAGIPADAWKTGQCDIYIFTAEVFGEKDGI